MQSLCEMWCVYICVSTLFFFFANRFWSEIQDARSVRSIFFLTQFSFPSSALSLPLSQLSPCPNDFLLELLLCDCVKDQRQDETSPFATLHRGSSLAANTRRTIPANCHLLTSKHASVRVHVLAFCCAEVRNLTSCCYTVLQLKFKATGLLGNTAKLNVFSCPRSSHQDITSSQSALCRLACQILLHLVKPLKLLAKFEKASQSFAYLELLNNKMCCLCFL